MATMTNQAGDITKADRGDITKAKDGDITKADRGDITKLKESRRYNMMEDYALGDRIKYPFKVGNDVSYSLYEGTVVGGEKGLNSVLFGCVTATSPQIGGPWRMGGEDKFCHIYVSFDNYDVGEERNPARPGTLRLICNLDRAVEASPGWYTNLKDFVSPFGSIDNIKSTKNEKASNAGEITKALA